MRDKETGTERSYRGDRETRQREETERGDRERRQREETEIK